MITCTTLEELYDAMLRNDPETIDEHGQWSSDLPTFGGEGPVCTYGVWSWNETHMIEGTCKQDLEIVDLAH